ncbi:MAG TPA: hypothetical protein VLE99_00135 [Candidatus Saccharimonadales bacterium]|nr:hypothetical protein [Candidatus Saccharimonadales bacterium]
MKNKIKGMSQEQMQNRLQELSSQEQTGQISDEGLQELNMLRSKM